MSIAVITASWKRPQVFAAFLAHTSTLTTDIYCAGSTADECKDIAKTHRIAYERVLNILSDKWNHAVQMAKQSTATHFLFMGSDDFMDANMFGYYDRYQGQHLALRDLYFMDTNNRQLAYWPGYRGRREGEPIGAAKLVRRDIMEALNWRPFLEGRNNALDFDMNAAITALGVKIDTVPMSDTGGICVDVKSSDSITTMRTILRQPGVQPLPAGYLAKHHKDLDKAMTFV